jgi:uncharacterized membrane protein (DUF485 family)
MAWISLLRNGIASSFLGVFVLFALVVLLGFLYLTAFANNFLAMTRGGFWGFTGVDKKKEV